MLKLLKIFLRSKFLFGKIDEIDLIIFDCEGKDAILQLLTNEKYKVLSVRQEKISEIFVNFKIIFFVIKNLFQLPLKQLYLIALIKEFSPKIVISHIPHSIEFSIIAKFLQNEIKFIAIQHGHHDLLSLSRSLKKKIFIPEFFCFGNYEKNIYEKSEIEIKEFFPIGSLRASLSLEYLSKNNQNKDIEYDICLISEYSPSKKKLFPSKSDDLQLIPSYPDHVGKIAYFCHKLRDEEKLRLVFCGDSAPDSIYQKIENDFYKKYLSHTNFEIIQKKRDTYPTYINLLKSKIVIGGYSTVMREALSLGKKVLSCNFTNNESINFPLNNICLFTKNNYEEFKKIVLKIIEMSEEDYFKQLNSDKKFIIEDSHQTSNMMRKKISNYLS